MGVDLLDRQLISKYNTGFQFLLCAINIFSNFACIVSLKKKKVSQLLMHCKKIYVNLKGVKQTKYE